MLDKPKIVVDRRERNRELLSELGRMCDVVMKTMDIGDYLISDRICVERKTVRDFESSLVNGRLFEQIRALSENYELPILIIEGDRNGFMMNENSIEGAIVSIYIKYGIQSILSDSPEKTAHILYTITRQEEREYDTEPSPKMGRKARSDSQFMEYIIGNMPGIGMKLARSLLERFGSVSGVADAGVGELMEVEKIGKKKAERIHSILHREYGEKDNINR